MVHEIIWPALATRVPAFASFRLQSSWAGCYEMNLFGHNGVVGAHPRSPEVIHAACFSGHGMQHATTAGRGVAELIANGGDQTLDLTPLAFTRIVQGRPGSERAVVRGTSGRWTDFLIRYTISF